jgi:glycosyltransferase involved in cell wall biosynthesis
MRGGAENLCDNLYNELIKRNYDVEYIKIPFKWYPPQEVINNCLIWRLLDLTESYGSKIDGVIATKFPSYLVRHPNKVAWLLHQHRSAYNLAFTEFDDLSPYGKIGEIVRSKIYKIDKISMKEQKKIYTISNKVADRLWKYNKIRGDVLYHPPPLFGRYKCDNYEDYIFYPSRLDATKRQDLVIKSMKHVRSVIKLKIAGTGPQLESYRKLAKELGLEKRIEFMGHVSNEELIDLFANAFAVIYTPHDEDLGYVTLEGFLSKKPVITCTDSGGSLEFVDDGVNGLIAEPEPEKIAKKIDLLYERGLNKSFGVSGYNKIINMNLTWDHVIKKLLDPIT